MNVNTDISAYMIIGEHGRRVITRSRGYSGISCFYRLQLNLVVRSTSCGSGTAKSLANVLLLCLVERTVIVQAIDILVTTYLNNLVGRHSCIVELLYHVFPRTEIQWMDIKGLFLLSWFTDFFFKWSGGGNKKKIVIWKIIHGRKWYIFFSFGHQR